MRHWFNPSPEITRGLGLIPTHTTRDLRQWIPALHHDHVAHGLTLGYGGSRRAPHEDPDARGEWVRVYPGRSRGHTVTPRARSAVPLPRCKTHWPSISTPRWPTCWKRTSSRPSPSSSRTWCTCSTPWAASLGTCKGSTPPGPRQRRRARAPLHAGWQLLRFLRGSRARPSCSSCTMLVVIGATARGVARRGPAGWQRWVHRFVATELACKASSPQGGSKKLRLLSEHEFGCWGAKKQGKKHGGSSFLVCYNR